MQLEYTSWTMSNNSAIKELDRTSFLYKSTRLPCDLEKIFQFTKFDNGDERKITLELKGKSFYARIYRDRHSDRMNLSWGKEFALQLEKYFPHHYKAHCSNNEPPDYAARMTLIPKSDVYYIVELD